MFLVINEKVFADTNLFLNDIKNHTEDAKYINKFLNCTTFQFPGLIPSELVKGIKSLPEDFYVWDFNIFIFFVTILFI